MAETIVKLVIEKITNVVVKEVLHLWGVDEQVEKVKRELDWIQAFLKDVDRKQIVDETQKQWVKEVRDVAYWIENVIDTFLCEVAQKRPSKKEVFKRMFRNTKKLHVIHNLGDEINKILARLQEISEKKVRYGINNLGEGIARKLPVRPPVLPDIEDFDVVGFDTDTNNIVKELLDETPKRCIVSIVGQGGLGKTTLAKKVYNSHEVKSTFHIRMWVAVNQEFELAGVLRKIIEELGPIDEIKRGKDEKYFLTKLYRSLKGKKYLLTIDDVWTSDLWIAIEKALPDDKNGSRILITTRISEVAKEADPTHEPYELNFLTEKPSLELFLRKALPNRAIQNECSSDLFDLAKQFVKKCSSLPLALIVLGGLLAKKKATYHVWSKAMQTMNWHANEQKACTEIIGTSYDDLPLALKSCFMYFAMFPEDYYINAPSLLRMWIAEGFIPNEENRTLEDTAESFLEDLVQRSMIQVSERALHNDSILECRIHDLLRDIAIQNAKEDNFLTVCSTRIGSQSSGISSHRLAVHNHNADSSELMKFANPNLGTLLCFDSQIPDCSGHMLLKVLSDMTTWGNFQAGMESLQGLYQLRYLKINEPLVGWNQRCFEKLIGGMKFLQTLDLASWHEVVYLPDCIWAIKTLRHVIIAFWSNIMGPPPITDLPNLQTLYYIRGRDSWKYTNLPNVPNLRIFKIRLAEGIPWGLVIAFLRITELGIVANDTPIELMKELPFFQHLTSLSYNGRLSIDLDVTMFPTHLTQLNLYCSVLQEDPMPVLEKLQELRLLSLYKAYTNQTMRCSAGGFPRLHKLSLVGLEGLETLEIEEGAFPMLKDLELSECPKLQTPRGLQHITTLTHLTWYSDPFKAKEIRNICKHVPSIKCC